MKYSLPTLLAHLDFFYKVAELFLHCLLSQFLLLDRVDLSLNFFAGLSSTRAFIFRLLHLPHVHSDRAIHQVCSLIHLDCA